MAVEIRKKAEKTRCPYLKEITRAILKKLGLDDAELSIQLVDNREIKKLNRKYRGENRITDCLSFSQREGDFKKLQPGLLGDIVVSVPRAKAQARQMGHSLKKEMTVLIVHGLLHLLGFNDELESGRKVMFRRQGKLVEWLDKKYKL